MRWQILVALGVVVIVSGWVLFQPRSNAPDLVVARDRLVASDAVVALFSPGGAEGYRFTSIPDRGWVWERTSGPEGKALPDAIIFNGRQYLLRIAEGCFIQLPPVRLPLVPGVTLSQKLVNQRGLEDQGGGRYAYDIESAEFGRMGTVPASMRVSEDLSSLSSGGAMLASTGEPPGPIWPGHYRMNRASTTERAVAEQLIATAFPSDYAEIVIRERVVGTTILSNAIFGPYRIVVPEACPNAPTRLANGIEGGQSEGLRSSPSPLRFAPGTTARIDGAQETALKLRAPVELFNALAEIGQFGTVPATSTSTIVAAINGGGFLAFQIDACTSRPWFSC